MPRVYTFYDRNGVGHHNLDKLLIPFRLMKNPGDWCELFEGPECLSGNVAAMCSIYSQKLGRRFKFKNMKDGTYRITVSAEPVHPPKSKRNRKRNSVATK